jgi:hypothetical protein
MSAIKWVFKGENLGKHNNNNELCQLSLLGIQFANTKEILIIGRNE